MPLCGAGLRHPDSKKSGRLPVGKQEDNQLLGEFQLVKGLLRIILSAFVDSKILVWGGYSSDFAHFPHFGHMGA